MTHTGFNEGMWQFSPIPNIEDLNFDKTLERFYNMKVPGLVRENIQNSLDGRLVGFDGPVKVTIKTGTMNTNDVPGINEVINHIKCLKGRNGYTKETIDHMVKKVKQDEVKYISFEDSNTRGLSGAKNGQSSSKSDTWAMYAYSKGVHSEEENEEIESTRGGSHGVGKIASNAASDINLMYFANCDAEGDQHLGGTVQLIEHEYEGRCYRSTGYFSDIEQLGENKTKFYPFKNNFNKVFEKETRGLKIIIPFVRDEYYNEREIIKSVCDSFFISILNEKLVVHVNDKKINQETIMNFINDENYYVQNIADMKKNFTPLYVNTFLNEAAQTINVSDGLNDYQFNLFFRYDEEIPKGRVSIIRTIGMKIEDLKIKGYASKPYNAVLIGGLNEDAYLKSLENESHTHLSSDHIKDPYLQKRANKFINNLKKEIVKIIEENIRANNPTDGIIDTKDILYIEENQFKKDLSDSMGTVILNKGNSIVKTSPDIKRKHEKQKGKPGEQDDKPTNTNPDPVKRKKRQPSQDDTDDHSQSKYKFSVHPKIVERLIVGNDEFLKFDFTQSKSFGTENSCDISLSIIDGMGIEYSNEFHLSDSYYRIIDSSTGTECQFKRNVIKDVQVKDGIAQLHFELKNNYNKALKFIYYVEV